LGHKHGTIFKSDYRTLQGLILASEKNVIIQPETEKEKNAK
jgi:hypothetical protein